MRFDVLTLFPEIFSAYLQAGLVGQAVENKLIDIQLWNFRDWGTGNRKNVDDKPYGGGPGMLLSCPPIFDAVEHVQTQDETPGQLVMLTPQGERLTQRVVENLAEHSRLLLLCGRYEGFDERIRIGLRPWEISAGDFIANGGEVPAMLIIDAVARLIPGVLGDEGSSQSESFNQHNLLEYPQYTRPPEFRGMSVPEILLSGNHQEIAAWREQQAMKRTQDRRADLLND